jgi:predicted hotdog family 3-hydroxylacyl-ACP dehydratase
MKTGMTYQKNLRMAENLLKEPIICKDQILELIPQKPPFVMVDSLYEYTKLTGITGFHIPKDNILVEDGFFSEPGLIEHMAQSMSLHRGYQGFLAGLNKPKTGFIGLIKSVEIFELPEVGTRLKTYVEILHEIMNVTSVSAKTQNFEGKLIAVSEMKTVTVD